jgi:hypothetical protein
MLQNSSGVDAGFEGKLDLSVSIPFALKWLAVYPLMLGIIASIRII